ncbi:hypothetical protein FEP63_05401 [Burkholderia multivorans]|uniref:hypothetical protein n=1 Tax=Burkholderia multivorans TaxID=87883 RepID=UPI00268138F6|nr:hypothetical protein [Burkholderia multivorans]MDR8873346.1 hypothetical protein [Burkholderia multivorans]MDR8883122.1 hypothetical protein [Burkholderia multivorans]MDR8889719.1 hypothetical protein [Burkholderia multivorans]MDR8894637.1 hypothetical protein [Burkholderia multivorans]MDR8901499.1 hypothetical protein [Burkholderia multivorans]
MQHISLQFSQPRYDAITLAQQTADAAWRALMDSMQCLVQLWTDRTALAGAGA